MAAECEKPVILYSIGKSVAGDVIKDEGVSFNIVLASFGEGKVTYSAYAICTDGTKDIIADNSSSSTLNWKPSKSGNWMIFFNINDETGQKIYYQNNLKVIDKINNTATIYYNAEDYKFDEVYFHYKVGNGEWTKAPGIKMEKTSEVDGYTHKITISLGEETNITGCFTNGKGLWDNNNSKNYELIKGCFGVSKGCINQVTEPTSLEIKKVIFNDEETYDVKYGETVKVTTKVAGNKGNCKYTVIATNTASGKIDVLSKESNDSTVSWIPSEKGGWKVTAFIEDEEGNVKCNSDYGISIN